MTKDNQLRYRLVNVLHLNHKEKNPSGPSGKKIKSPTKQRISGWHQICQQQHAKQDDRKESIWLGLYIQPRCSSSIKAMKNINSFKPAQTQYSTQEPLPRNLLEETFIQPRDDSDTLAKGLMVDPEYI